MGYIKNLRKLVGSKPLIVCGCGCLIFNEKSEVLLQKRNDDNSWGTPGGSMELGESMYDTVIREVKEETGLDVEELELFNIYSGESQHYFYPNGDETYIVNILFKSNKYSGNLKSNKESRELKFFKIEDIPENIHKPFKPVLIDLKDKNNS